MLTFLWFRRENYNQGNAMVADVLINYLDWIAVPILIELCYLGTVLTT